MAGLGCAQMKYGSERASDLGVLCSRETSRDYGKRYEMWAPGVGLEPTTNGLTVRCSAELSYPGWIGLPWYQQVGRILGGSGAAEVALHAAATWLAAHLAQGSDLQLANPLLGDAHPVADLLEGPDPAVGQAESHRDDLPFPFV